MIKLRKVYMHENYIQLIFGLKHMYTYKLLRERYFFGKVVLGM